MPGFPGGAGGPGFPGSGGPAGGTGESAKSDGTLTGCRARIVADLGAYQLLLTPIVKRMMAGVK